jgi:hypothetical protein
MAVVQVGHSYDGSKYTVNDLVKKPTWVPNIVRDMVKDANIAEWLLRPGPTAVGGAVAFEETLALYAGSEGEIVAEFGEIPGTEAPMRTAVTRATTKRGVHLKISDEMVTRNDVGRVRDEMRMVRDTLVNGRDKVFFDATMNNANVQTFAAASAGVADGWYSQTDTVSKIRYDIARATYLLASQGVTGAQYSEKLGYKADTLIIHPQVAAMMVQSAEVARAFEQGGPSSQGISFTGLLPTKFMFLDVFTSWRAPIDTAIVCQRNAMGFISKEWPLRGTPLRHDEDTQSWRTNFSYRDLVAIDNPKAVVKITNIDGSGVVTW